MTTTYGVKYIGSKAALVDQIIPFVEARIPAGAPKTVLDCFTGTTRVAQAFRSHGWQVTSSDLAWASEAYAHAFLLRTPESSTQIPHLVKTLEEWKEKPLQETGNWIEHNYCDVSGAEGGLVRMWRPENGRRADRIRHMIAVWEKDGIINHHEAMILIACLIHALDKVDNSVGVQQAYLKNWATRTANTLTLEDLPYPTGPVGTHLVGNTLTLNYPTATVAYLDPPYSAHSYATYYHIWDSITRWDKPAVGLKTNRRMDRVSGSTTFDEAMSSPWNSKRSALKAFLLLVQHLPVRYVCISYNDESLVPLSELEAALKETWPATEKKVIPYKRNIMSQIGNAATTEGDKKTTNNEVLLWVEKSPA